MRRLTVLAAIICVAVTQSSVGANDLDGIRTRGTLRVLVGGTVDKFIVLGEGAAAGPGMDREILEGFAALQRLKLEIVQAPTWNDVVQWLVEGKGDVAAGALTVTDSRRKLINFTPEVFPIRHVVVTLAPHRIVATVEELRQERLGVQRGTILGEIAGPLMLDPKKVDESIPLCSTALINGTVSACIVALDELISEQRKNPNLRAGMLVGPSYSYAYGVRKEDPALLRVLSDYVGNVRRSGTWNRLVVKYFGEKALAALKTARQP